MWSSCAFHSPLLYVILCFSVFLKYLFTTPISILLAKSTSISPSMFHSLTPNLPSPSHPLFFLHLCAQWSLLQSPLSTTYSNTLQSFSLYSISQPTCGAQPLTTFIITPSISTSHSGPCTTTLFTSATFFVYSFFRIKPSPSLFLSTWWYSLNPAPMLLALLLLHLVRCTHRTSIFLLYIMSVRSPPLPLIGPALRVPTLNPTLLTFSSLSVS